MTSPHLSERDLQDAAEAAAQLPAAQAAHLRGCYLCQGRVATYQHLFAAAAQLPAPAFDFDLTASVLAHLPKARPAFPWVLCVVAALVLGVVSAFLAVFGGALGQAFQGLSSQLGVGLALIAGCLVAGQCLELVARHRRQMRLLAFS
jgi:membrane protease YdiL (CAAX protease family)